MLDRLTSASAELRDGLAHRLGRRPPAPPASPDPVEVVKRALCAADGDCAARDGGRSCLAWLYADQATAVVAALKVAGLLA